MVQKRSSQSDYFTKNILKYKKYIFQFPHRGNAYFYFSPQYYYNLHPHRYATPCRDLTPFKYDTHWADYKGAW